MDIETLRVFLGWCSLLNMAVLLAWFLLFIFAKDWVYSLHGKWSTLSKQHFEIIHYCGMGLYKLFVFMIFIIPYLVIRFAL